MLQNHVRVFQGMPHAGAPQTLFKIAFSENNILLQQKSYRKIVEWSTKIQNTTDCGFHDFLLVAKAEMARPHTLGPTPKLI